MVWLHCLCVELLQMFLINEKSWNMELTPNELEMAMHPQLESVT